MAAIWAMVGAIFSGAISDGSGRMILSLSIFPTLPPCRSFQCPRVPDPVSPTPACPQLSGRDTTTTTGNAIPGSRLDGDPGANPAAVSLHQDGRLIDPMLQACDPWY